MNRTSSVTDGRRQRGESSRQRILSESLRLFALHGYSGTSLADIRQATGLPATSLHHHFGSKAGICLAAIENVAGTLTGVELRKRLLRIADTAGRLETLVKALLKQLQREYPALLLVIRLAMDADDIDPSIRRAVERVRRSARDDLVASLEIVFEPFRPAVAKKEMEAAARRIMVVLDGLIISRLTDTPGMKPAWTAAELETMVLATAMPARD